MIRNLKNNFREYLHGRHVRKFSRLLLHNFLLVILPTLIPLTLIASAVYHYNTSNIQEEIKVANNNNLEGIRNVGDMIASGCDMLLTRIVSDDDTMILLSYDHITPATLQERFNNLYKTMDFVSTANQFIGSTYIYFENSSYVFSTNYDSMEIKYFSDANWLSDYMAKKNQKICWQEARIPKDKFGNKKNPVISFFRPVHNYGKDGVVIVNLDDLKLGKIIDSSDLPAHTLMIIDQSGQILYHSNLSLVTNNIGNMKEFKNLDYTKQQSLVIWNTKGVAEVVSVIKSNFNNCSYISITPVNQYSHLTEELIRFLAGSLIICFFIAVAISVAISIKLYQPVKNMLKLFKNRGDWEVQFGDRGEKRFDEIKFLTRSITQSFDRERQMQVTLKNRLILLHKAQSIALQSQINPHFLYNTLETINWKAMSLTHGENEVSLMIGILSKLLRLSLETDNSLTTVQEEIEHAKYYLEIQQMRFDDLFEVVWDINPSIYQFRAVKLSLQPIVENAIYHGIKAKGSHGVIRISGIEVPEGIELSVTDNGVGMTEEEVRRLNCLMKTDYIKENEHIGLLNVNQRIKLLFGDPYGIHIVSKKNGFTRVILRFPKEKTNS